MSSFLVPRGSSGSFVGTTGRLVNPRSGAQIRAASQTSDNKTVLVTGRVTTDIPPASSVGFEFTPSTSGRALITYNGGDELPTEPVVVTNYTLQRFLAYESTQINLIILERRDDKWIAVSGLAGGTPFLNALPVNLTAGNTVVDADPGDLLRVSLIDVDGTVQVSSAWDTVFEPNQEFGVQLTFITNPPHTLSIVLDNLGLNVGWYDKQGFHPSPEPIVLSNVGDYVQIKSVSPDNSVWIVKIDGRRPHNCEIEKSSGQSIPNGLFTAIQFNSVVMDDGILSDIANNRIVIQRGGKYIVSAIVGLDNPGGITTSANMQLFVNGVGVRGTSMIPAAANLDFVFDGTWLLDLAPLDLLTLQVRHFTTGSVAQNVATAAISRCRLMVSEIH